MKVRLILIGMAAGLLLPLAAANAGVVFNPGLSQVGAGTGVGRGAVPIAENFWRTVGDHDDNDNDNDGDDTQTRQRPIAQLFMHLYCRLEPGFSGRIRLLRSLRKQLCRLALAQFFPRLSPYNVGCPRSRF